MSCICWRWMRFWSFIGSLPEWEQSWSAQWSPFLWASGGTLVSQTPLFPDYAGWVSGLLVSSPNQNKGSWPTDHRRANGLGNKAAKLLHGNSMQTWGFLRLKLKFLKKVTQETVGWETGLWFPLKISGTLPFLGWAVTSKRIPHSFTRTLCAFLSDS